MAMEPKKPHDPEFLGGWRITGRLGEGGFGTVFIAEKGARKAAIKVVRDTSVTDTNGSDRFHLEIAALQKLTDPFIAGVIDSDLDAEVPWFATEFINGPTLEEKVKYEGTLEERQWFNLAANIFHALKTTHLAGVVHKDVKPSNIILGETGNKLIDFGIAHISGLTRKVNIGDFEGSLPYSSPESSTGKSLPGMDVFSAAVTLAFAGLGRTIWKSNSELQMSRSINEDEPDLEGLSDLQQTFLKPLLNKNISDRPSSDQAYETCLRILQKLEGTRDDVDLRSWKRATKRIRKSNPAIKVGTAGIFLLALASISFYFNSHSSTSSNREVKISPSAIPTTSIQASKVTTPSPVGTGKIKASTSQECENEYLGKGPNVLTLCLSSANAGDKTSIYYIGRSYYDNQNYKEAEKWFLRGAIKQDLNSTRYLIETYTQEANTTERDRWTKICADTSYGATDTSPIKDIAYCKMMEGLILTRAGATKQSILYLTDAADLGNGDAATYLGIYYRDLDDKVNALKWLTRASELGNNNGINALIGYAMKIGDDALTMKWLLVSANSGNQVNMGVLAEEYYFKKDSVSAKKWATKGFSFGDITSTFILGAVTYDVGQQDQGKSLLIKAANKGNIEAIRMLGNIYRINEKNYTEAAVWYEKLASRNDFTGTAIYSSLLFLLGKDQDSCTYNDKVLSLGNQAKANGTYDATTMDTFMSSAQTTSDSYCSKLYKK